MEWAAGAAAVSALVAGGGGLLVPRLIERLPEPAPEEPGEADGAAVADAPVRPPVPQEPKELYADIAALPGLQVRAVLAAAVVGGLLGLAVGWQEDLVVLLPLVPAGVALAVIDWRTRLLPTRLVAPSYGVVVAAALLAALLAGSAADLVRAAWGWAIAGGTYLLLWLVHPRGMGYGDVRLSGVLGIALGFVGWGALALGLWSGFLLGALGGAVLALARRSSRKAYPFGPFMLLGAVVGVLGGEAFASRFVLFP